MVIEAGMLKRWRLFEPTRQDDPHRLARQLGVDPLVATLLLRRGIHDRDAADPFLSPRLGQLHDPARLPGIRPAAQRIVQAVRDGQPIVIYGDYDVDGITASAILWHTLTAIGGQAQIYVPHRLEEGYGLNNEAIAQLCEHRPLIVTVDCGITAVEQAKLAKQAGVDLIITDHHAFDPAALPQAHTLVHPGLPATDNQPAYPFGELCGAGVAFKLAWQVLRLYSGSERLPGQLRQLLLDLVSLAALGTVADVVPLVDENRVLTTFGLGQIKRTQFAGLNALIDAARLRDEKIDAYHVGFVLGPRLNACGRMGHAKHAVHLLTQATAREAEQIAGFLTRENDHRRATEREIFQQARQLIVEQGYDTPEQRAIVVGQENWHPGVVGIVASRLVEAFGRPVVMLNIDNGSAHGSARSVDGVSMHDALQHCEQHLTQFGGHAMAAGLRLPTASLDAFRRDLVAYVNQRLLPEDLTAVVDVDAVCELASVNLDTVGQIQKLAPFGRCNPAPLLCVRRVTLAEPPRCVGREARHLSLTLRQGDTWRKAIGFSMGHLIDRLAAGMQLDVVFEPQTSVWQGAQRVEMHMRDIRPVREG